MDSATSSPHTLSSLLQLPPEVERTVANPDLSKAIQLVEQAFQLSEADPNRAFNLFEKSSIAFLQAIRSTVSLPAPVQSGADDVLVPRCSDGRHEEGAGAQGGGRLHRTH